MKKQQIWGLLVLLLVTAGALYPARLLDAADKAEKEEKAAYEQFLESLPVAQADGETVSPNGRYEVRTIGAGDSYVSGVRIPEALQIVRLDTGEVLWEDAGCLRQSVSWSPGNNFVAIARGGRTWNTVTVISTAYWTSWDVTLPDGGGIPEYTFLPEENWCQWVDTDAFLLTVGQGGDAGEQHTYYCWPSTAYNSDELSGGSLEQITEVLSEAYDFDHDGETEAVELIVRSTEDITPYFPSEYALWVQPTEGGQRWMQGAYLAHVGWTSIFALELDGQDYLLRYDPHISTGCGYYSYQLFSLDERGQEVLLRENSVEFDVNFSPTLNGSFDPAAIAAFLEEVHGYLDGSTLLLSTEGGAFRTGGSGAEFREDFKFWDDQFCPYDEEMTLEENLRNYAERTSAARNGAE